MKRMKQFAPQQGMDSNSASSYNNIGGGFQFAPPVFDQGLPVFVQSTGIASAEDYDDNTLHKDTPTTQQMRYALDSQYFEQPDMTTPVYFDYPFLITVLYRSGWEIQFNVESAMTVADVKKILFQEEGIPIAGQSFFFNGAFVSDDCLLGDIGVGPDSVLVLSLSKWTTRIQTE